MMINKRLLSMIPGCMRLVLSKTFINWISLICGVCLWLSIAGMLEDMYAEGAGAFSVVAAAVCAVCIAARFIFARVSSALTHKISSEVKKRLRESIYNKLSALGTGASGGYGKNFSTSEIVQLAGEGVEQLESYFGNYLPQFFYALLAPVTLFIVFMRFSMLTAAVLLICVPLIPAAIVGVQKIARRLLAKYWGAYSNLGDGFLENLQGLTTLKVYGADAERHKKMNEDAENFRIITMKVLTMQLNSITIMDLVAYGGTAAGGILAARAFMMGHTGLGGAVAMIFLASEFFLAMRALGSFFHVAMNGLAASDRMFKLLDMEISENGESEFVYGDIDIQDLGFSYDGERQTLSGISFKIRCGEIVSAAGESGCGKSTLAAVLSGELRGYSGSVKISGTEMHDISLESLRRGITVVSSDSYIFAGTVRKTLLEGRAGASRQDMENILAKVNLLDFVNSKGGLDMPLSERGANLSGGQRQRLALARALIKESPVYIFDEASSNIDAESEEIIMNVIRSMRGKRTVLLISHRLANCEICDNIAFIEGGKLIEYGSHEKLAASGGSYAGLYSTQKELENIGRGGAANAQERI